MGKCSPCRYWRLHLSVFRTNKLFDYAPADRTLGQAGIINSSYLARFTGAPPHPRIDGRFTLYTLMAAWLLSSISWRDDIGFLYCSSGERCSDPRGKLPDDFGSSSSVPMLANNPARNSWYILAYRGIVPTPSSSRPADDPGIPLQLLGSSVHLL